MSSKKIRILGDQLRAARQAAGLTQEQLGNKVGCTGENISSIERGEWGASGPLALNLSRVLRLNVQEDSPTIGDEPKTWLSRQERQILNDVEELLETGDETTKKELRRQIDLVRRAAKSPRGRASGED